MGRTWADHSCLCVRHGLVRRRQTTKNDRLPHQTLTSNLGRSIYQSISICRPGSTRGKETWDHDIAQARHSRAAAIPRVSCGVSYEFKAAYGDELLETTEQAIEEIWQRHGLLGLVRLLLDLAWRVPAEHLAELRQDIRYGLRMLRASPGFAAVALISLSLGISIATCAYSELNGMLRDLPGVPRPNELVAIQAPSSYPAYQRYRQLDDLFSSTFAYVAPVPFGISAGGRTERTWGHLVTPLYFTTLGIHPAMGCFFDQSYEQPGRAPAVVVSDRYWREHLGSDPAIVGKSLRINGYASTIIGVGPRDFLGASPVCLPRTCGCRSRWMRA